MKHFNSFLFVACICFSIISLFSCVSVRPISTKCSRCLSDPGIKTTHQLAAFLCNSNPDISKKKALQFANLYITEGKLENINSDAAFAQMCLETGFLRFGGLVTADMHNYCGLGSIDSNHPGEKFLSEQIGIRAHIQHLQAYATPAGVSLHTACVDPRYRYVQPRGKAPTIFLLSGTWAADPLYGEKINQLMMRMESF